MVSPIRIWLSLGFFLVSCSGPKTVSVPSGVPARPGEMADELVEKTLAQTQPNRPLRVGIMTFTPTQADLAAANNFGEYFTESLITGLKSNGARIKLFERKRLESIFTENNLAQSGLVDQEAAKRIGELAPLDMIITGTYTRLANSVEVNGRILEVVTGEILDAFHKKIELSEDLRSLFPETAPAPAAPGLPPAADPVSFRDSCSPAGGQAEEILADLSSPEKIEAAVAQAITVPFTLPCGKAHFEIMFAFRRYHLYPPKYQAFLITTLAGIKNPQADDRAREILDYFHRDSCIDDAEWKAGLAAARKIGKGYLSVYLGFLFPETDTTAPRQDIQRRRIDEFCGLALQKKVGLPVAVSFETAFGELLGAFSPFGDYANQKLLCYAYGKYRAKLPAGRPPETFRMLKSMYFREPEEKQKGAILEWMAEYAKAAKPDETLASDLFEFAVKLKHESIKPENPPPLQALYARHFDILLTSVRAPLAASLPQTKFTSQKEDRIRFCLENNLSIPGFTPSVDSLITQLSTDNLDAQREAAEFLRKMGEKAKPAEEKVLKLLRRSQHREESGVTNLQWALISILGSIKTKNADAHRELLDLLASTDYMVPDTAMVALAKIGPSIIPLLQQEMAAKEAFIQIRILGVFGRMGKTAKSVLPFLRERLVNTKELPVQDAIEDAIEKIK